MAVGLSPFSETEERLRGLNGVLDLALLLAIDRIRDQGGPAIEVLDWQEKLLGDAAGRLRDLRRFPGRLSLFSADEIMVLAERLGGSGSRADPARASLMDEIEFELARRGARPSGNARTIHERGEDDIG